MLHRWIAAAAATIAVTTAPGLASAKTPLAECLKKIKADPKTVKAELKMVTLAPAGSQWAKEFQAWTDEALEESDCQLQLKWYWNGGGGGDELRMVADLRQGQKHGAAMTAVGLGEIYKEVLLFQLPGLFDNWPALDAARAAEKTFFEEEFAKRGFAILGWGDIGAGKIMSAGVQIKTPADLKGLTAYHLPGDVISPIFYAKLGLKAAPMSIGEVGSHLGKSIQVLGMAPYAAEQLQLASKVTHLTVMTPAFGIGALVVKKEKIDAMPPELKEVLLRTGASRAAALTNTIRKQDAEALNRMKTSKTTYTPTAEEMAMWKTAAQETRKALRGAPFNPEVFDRITKGK
ncbi:TRAP transporter substrate-binding protein DctP [Myxococcota bacterium]|nr:TRAP transporter substrate-binding protein DctP [Myxococcota bacterium]